MIYQLHHIYFWYLSFNIFVVVSGIDDMTKLAYLHEPGVLQNLRHQYDMNEIYVSTSK